MGEKCPAIRAGMWRSFNTVVKKSIFRQNAPKNLRTLFQMQSSQSYEELVATTMQYLQVSRVYDSGFMRSAAHLTTSEAHPIPNAMEVDALIRGGKGGITRDKGKDKAMGSSVRVPRGQRSS